MDLSTFWQKSLEPFLAGQVRIYLAAGAAAAIGHGYLRPDSAGAVVEIGAGAVSLVAAAGWQVWTDYVQPILKDQLEILKAKSHAQAEKIKEAGLKPVTVTEIAAQSPTMDVAKVINVIGTLPPAVQANIAGMTGGGVKGALAVLALLLGAMAWPGDASAQTQRRPVARPEAAPASDAAPSPVAAAVPPGVLPTLTSWAPKPHFLKLLNPLGLPDPLCITDHPSSTCPTGTTTVDGKIVGGVQMTGNPQTDFTNFVQRGGITFVRDMKRADQFLSYPCTATSAAGCVKTDVLSSSCLEAIIPIAMLIVNGPPSNAAPTTDGAATPATTSSPTSPTSPTQTSATSPTAPLTLNGLPAVQAANNALMSTDSPAITSADDGVVTAAAKLDVVFLAVQGPALKQGCGGWVQNQVTQFANFATGLMTFVTTLGVSGAVL